MDVEDNPVHMRNRVTIWHNPRCSKSRQALALLEQAGVEVNIRQYVDEPPTRAELSAVLRQLDSSPRDLVRRNEPVYATLELEGATDERLLEAMVEHPILIERPIVIVGDRAVVGRPPERVTSILD
jgi:arsenate reductase